MNGEGGLAGRPRHSLLTGHVERSTEAGQPPPRLTLLQEWLITAHLMLEDAREELSPEQWRAFVWILCDLVGYEAAKAVVGEALEATQEEVA